MLAEQSISAIPLKSDIKKGLTTNEKRLF